MVRHTAESYREAALEHLKVAQMLHSDLAEHGAAHYWAGLAVECMLRAYRLRLHTAFESRHDLARLAREARFLEIVGPDLVAELASALSEVVLRWSNDHRYRSGRLVERWLRDSGLDRRIQGDRLKYSSGCIVDAANTIVQTGVRQWPSKTS